jgi:hypothetical protein
MISRNRSVDANDVSKKDVDTHYHELFVDQLKEHLPYFESASKKLPHGFTKCKVAITKKRVQSRFEGIEILSGQCSYCRLDAEVYSADKEIKPFSEEFIQEDEHAPFAEVKHKQPLVYTHIIIGELLTHIDIKFCDGYDTRFRIGAALFNAGFDKSVFD